MCWLQDPSCGPRAVEQVREFGGVLEHPAYSTLWAYCGMPRPGQPRDAYGGYTLAVDQCDWGHKCRKPTWLYIVGGPPRFEVRHQLELWKGSGAPTHCVCTGPGQKKRLPVATKKVRRMTPPLFADFLIGIAKADLRPRRKLPG